MSDNDRSEFLRRIFPGDAHEAAAPGLDKGARFIVATEEQLKRMKLMEAQVEQVNAPLRDITQAEWNECEWICVSTVIDPDPVYIRSYKRTHPPEDGYHYEEHTRLGDAEQKWRRAKTYREAE